jgi:hypothetical protein
LEENDRAVKRAVPLLIVCTACTQKLDLGARESAEPALECVPGTPAPAPVRPLDLVFILDNSSSMVELTRGLETGLATTFAPTLEAQGVDYRVVVISRYGWLDLGSSDYPVCIPAPLGATDCHNPDGTPLTHNPPRFFHYSAQIDSEDGLCVTLQAFNTPDELPAGERDWTPIAPNGWSEFLRPEAWTSFVVMSDGDPDCTLGDLTLDSGDETESFNAASLFDAALIGLAPGKFSNETGRRYDWTSVAAFEALGPVEPSAPLVTAICDGDGGLVFQALSILTNSKRYSLCDPLALESVFQNLATDAVQRAATCAWTKD